MYTDGKRPKTNNGKIKIGMATTVTKKINQNFTSKNTYQFDLKLHYINCMRHYPYSTRGRYHGYTLYSATNIDQTMEPCLQKHNVIKCSNNTSSFLFIKRQTSS